MFAYRKGEVVAVFSNEGKISGERILAVPGTGWKEGEWAVDVLSGYLVRVGKGGRVRVRVRNGEPRVLVALKGLEGSGIAAGVVAPAELKGVVGMVLGWIAGWRWAFLAGIAEKAMLRKR